MWTIACKALQRTIAVALIVIATSIVFAALATFDIILFGSMQQADAVLVNAEVTEETAAARQNAAAHKAALDNAIANARTLDASSYTETSYAVLANAIANAQAVSSKNLSINATESDVSAYIGELDAAFVFLSNAMNDLKVKTAPPVGLIMGIAAWAVALVTCIAALIAVQGKRSRKNVHAVSAQKLAHEMPGGHYEVHARREDPLQHPLNLHRTGNAWNSSACGPLFTMQSAGQMQSGRSVQQSGRMQEDFEQEHRLRSSFNAFGTMDLGSLVRLRNNELIRITKPHFSIGRDWSCVDYCVEGNAHISRVHASTELRGNTVFLSDNRASNGTFVNGRRLAQGGEVRLEQGDVVRLATEDFRYFNANNLSKGQVI